MEPSRKGAFDLTYAEGDFTYRDSYFGGTDFVGQEVVWRGDEPVWAMNYYGRVLASDVFDGATGAEVIRAALSAMYQEGRFLGGFDFSHEGYIYEDRSSGAVGQFTGIERILRDGRELYRLDYHGGVIVP
ncbi:MAG: DUF5680 domain-containing protein [Maritimibacter sp.]